MNKSAKVLLLLLCIGIILSSCTKEKEAETNDGAENTNNIINKASKVIENNLVDSDIAIELKNGLKDESLSPKANNTYNYESLEINNKENTLLLFCVDPVYDIIYYVNYGNDYYIYRIKDGKSELAVEMPAKRLFCHEGNLYFILESYELFSFRNMKDGNIMCYNPVNGEVSIVCDAEAESMSVYEDGIYYKTIREYIQRDDGMFSIDMGFYFYSFSSGKTEEITDINKHHIKWKDYFITSEADLSKADKNGISTAISLKLETLDKSKSIKLLDRWGFGSFAVAGNKCYYYYDGNFYVHNLDSNELLKVPIFKDFSYNDFTIANGMIYFAGFYQYNPETGVLSKIKPENSKESVYELYTDGTNLFGICGINDIKSGAIKRIEIAPVTEGYISTKDEDGITFELNRYKFKSLPLGDE